LIIIYRPEGGQEHRWDLRSKESGKLKSSEAELVEETLDLTWVEFEQKLLRGWMRGLRTLAWVLLRRDDPALTLDGFDPDGEELDVDLDAAERAQLRAEVERSPDLTPEQRAEALAKFADPAGEPGPKGRSGNAETASLRSA